jgi:hypothetical protein
MNAAEKAQKPTKGVISCVPHSDASWSNLAMFSADWTIWATLSSHQFSGAVASSLGGSTGPTGVDSGVGRKGAYSR